MSQTVNLSADVSLGTWTPSGGATGFGVLSDASNGTLISSPSSPDLGTYRGRFSSPAGTPSDNNGHVLRLTCRRASGSGGWVIAKVYSSGGTLAATLSTQATITSSFLQIDLALSSGQAAAAGSTSVEVEIIANQNGFGSTFEVSEARFLFSDAIIIRNFTSTDTMAFSETVAAFNLGKNFSNTSDTISFINTFTINIGFNFGFTGNISFSETVTFNLSKNFSLTGSILFFETLSLQVAVDVYFIFAGELIFSNNFDFTLGPSGYNLLSSPEASRFFYVDLSYYNRHNDLTFAFYSEEGRQIVASDARTEEGTDVLIQNGTYYEPRIVSSIVRRVSLWTGSQIGGGSTPSFSNMILSNGLDIDEHDLDELRMGRVEGRQCYVSMGGMLENGDYLPFIQNLAIFTGSMSMNLLAGENNIEIVLQDDQWKFNSAFSKRLFQGHCLSFLVGTDTVTFGDVLDRNGDFGIEFWLRVDDVSVGGDIIMKDPTGSTGWGIQCNRSSNGSIRFFTRDLSSVSLDTITNVIFSQQWHRVSIFYSHTVQTKYIYIDKTLIASVSSLTGNVIGNSANLVFGGGGFVGKIDDIRIWSVVRPLSDIKFNTYLEMIGTEVGLDAYYKMEDTTNNGTVSDSVNILTGPIGTLNGTTEFDLSDWCDSSLIGRAYPVCYGCPGEIDPVLVDPYDDIWMYSDGPSPGVLFAYDKGVLLTVTVNYTVENARSLIKNVTALTGAFTLRVNGNNTGGTYANTVAGIFGKIAIERTTCSVNANDITVVNSEWPGEAGIYRNGSNASETIKTVLDELCEGPLLAYFPDNNNIIRLVEFEEPLDDEFDFDITDDNITSTVTAIPQEGPVWACNVGYDQMYTEMSDNDAKFLLSGSPQRYKYVTEQFRYARFTDKTVRERYPNTAREITKLSNFTKKVDALKAATKEVVLFRWPHEMYKVDCSLDILGAQVNNTVRLRFHTLGLSVNPKNFKIIDMETDGNLKKISLSIWGRPLNPFGELSPP